MLRIRQLSVKSQIENSRGSLFSFTHQLMLILKSICTFRHTVPISNGPRQVLEFFVPVNSFITVRHELNQQTFSVCH